jgi:hypothetical protein
MLANEVDLALRLEEIALHIILRDNTVLNVTTMLEDAGWTSPGDRDIRVNNNNSKCNWEIRRRAKAGWSQQQQIENISPV